MGAGQSTKEGNEVARGLVRRAFSKEHGRDPTKEEEARFMTAFGRDDPMDAMFQSFNPGSDAARRQWRRRQQAGGDGAASEATQSEVTSEGDGAEAEA